MSCAPPLPQPHEPRSQAAPTAMSQAWKLHLFPRGYGYLEFLRVLDLAGRDCRKLRCLRDGTARVSGKII